MTTDQLITNVEKAAAHVNRSPTDGHKQARVRRLYRLGAELKAASEVLVRKLGKGYDWIETHQDHPKLREREDQWIGWLHEYEAIEDALARASEVDR